VSSHGYRCRLYGCVIAICLGLLAVASLAETGAGAATAHRLLDRVPDQASGAAMPHPAGGPVAHAASVPYLGGPVLRSSRIYLVFWQPDGSGLSFDPGYVALVTQFAQDVAADSHRTSNVFGLTGEYRDSTGPAAYDVSYAGSALATDQLPSNGCTEPADSGPGWSLCLTDAQLQNELEQVVTAQHWPHGGDNIYVLLTPQGFGDCQDASSSSCALGGPHSGYCGYHSWTTSGLLYAVVPYNAVPGHCQSGNPRPNSSTADPALSTVTHELIETTTDPYGNAWIAPNGDEIADVCLSDFGRVLGGSGSGAWDEVIAHHHYWLQEVFSRLEGRCEPRPRADRVTILGTRRLAAGASSSFIARAHQPGGSVHSFNWSFGDGRGGGGKYVSHIWARPGSYRLVLRITDSADNWAYATATVRVTRRSRGAGGARRR
jgi:hypothetical protein